MRKNNSKKIEQSIGDRRIPGRGRRLSDKFNQIVLDNIPISLITINDGGYITSVNKYFENNSRIKDYHNHNIYKDKFFFEDNLADDYKKMLSGEKKIVRREHFYEKDSQGVGEDRYFKIIAVPYKDKDGHIEGAISMALDNTDAVISKNKLVELNKILEERVEQRTEELHNVNKELNKTLELKSIFMADVSHEFRTALTIMQCSLELIAKSEELKDDNLDLFRNISTEIKRVSGMLTDLALLAKPHSNITARLRFEKIDLNSLIANVCEKLRVVAAEKNITIEHKYAGKPAKIMGNIEDLEKLLTNLVRNAIKYNKENGWIKVWVAKAEDAFCLNVEDGGFGISELDLPHIFERFYRADKSRNRKEGGSGLGLAICKHIAEEHGGYIGVSSKPKVGTLFVVHLPVKFDNGYF